MLAAVLSSPGAPTCAEFDEPVAGRGEAVVEVLAAGVNHLDVRKSAAPASAAGDVLPRVVGTDGVGTLEDGRLVYFDSTIAPFGAIATRTLVRCDEVIPLPDNVAIDIAVAAALGNAGLAAYIPLLVTAALAPGERVLILGGTSTVGKLALQLAKHAGAGATVVAGRDAHRLDELRALGADACVPLDCTELSRAILDEAGGPIDVIVDLLWGEPALQALPCAGVGARYLQIGNQAGLEASMPAQALRSRKLVLHGVAGPLEPLRRRAEAYVALLKMASAGTLRVDVERIPLHAVDSAWQRQAGGPHTKLVIDIGRRRV